jgi:hypothetical protein
VICLLVPAASLAKSKDELLGSGRAFAFAHSFLKDEYLCTKQDGEEYADANLNAYIHGSCAAHFV